MGRKRPLSDVRYEILVDVRPDLAVGVPGMVRLADILADGLERAGFREGDYGITVHGPPELTIGVAHR